VQTPPFNHIVTYSTYVLEHLLLNLPSSQAQTLSRTPSHTVYPHFPHMLFTLLQYLISIIHHLIPLHFVSLRFTSFHFVSLHFTALQCISPSFRNITQIHRTYAHGHSRTYPLTSSCFQLSLTFIACVCTYVFNNDNLNAVHTWVHLRCRLTDYYTRE